MLFRVAGLMNRGQPPPAQDGQAPSTTTPTPPPKRRRIADKSRLLEMLKKYRDASDFSCLSTVKGKVMSLNSSIENSKKSICSASAHLAVESALASGEVFLVESFKLKRDKIFSIAAKLMDCQQVYLCYDRDKFRCYNSDLQKLADSTITSAAELFITAGDESIRIGHDKSKHIFVELVTASIRETFQSVDDLLSMKAWVQIKDFQKKLELLTFAKSRLQKHCPELDECVVKSGQLLKLETRESVQKSVEELRKSVAERTELIDTILPHLHALNTNKEIIGTARTNCMERVSTLQEAALKARKELSETTITEFVHLYGEFAMEYQKIVTLTSVQDREHCCQLLEMDKFAICMEKYHNTFSEWKSHEQAKEGNTVDIMNTLKQTLVTVATFQPKFIEILQSMKDPLCELDTVVVRCSDLCDSIRCTTKEILRGIHSFSMHGDKVEDSLMTSCREKLASLRVVTEKLFTIECVVKTEISLLSSFPLCQVSTVRCEAFNLCTQDLTLTQANTMKIIRRFGLHHVVDDVSPENLCQCVLNEGDLNPVMLPLSLIARKFNYTSREHVTRELEGLCISEDEEISHAWLEKEVEDPEVRGLLMKFIGDSEVHLRASFYSRIWKCKVPWRLA